VSDKKTPRVAWSCGRHEVLIILMRRLQKMIRGARGNFAKFGIVGFQSKSHALNAAATLTNSMVIEASESHSLNTCSWNE
jgi:hypothetical protein